MTERELSQLKDRVNELEFKVEFLAAAVKALLKLEVKNESSKR